VIDVSQTSLLCLGLYSLQAFNQNSGGEPSYCVEYELNCFLPTVLMVALILCYNVASVCRW